MEIVEAKKEKISKICSLVSIGVAPETACAAHGLTERETCEILESGEMTDPLRVAKAQAYVRMIQKILSECGGKGAMFVLGNMIDRDAAEAETKDNPYSWLKKRGGQLLPFKKQEL